MRLAIAPFLPAEEPESSLRECYDIQIASMEVDFPGSPRPSYESYAGQLRKPASYAGPRRLWAAHLRGQMVGLATVVLPERENHGLAITNVVVSPDSRRQGVGTALMREIVPELGRQGRTMVSGHGLRVGGDGDGWTRSLGFAPVQERAWQSLDITAADLTRWRVPAPTGFRIEQWIDTVPESLVAGFARARTAMLDAPAAGSGFRGPTWTAERVRLHEAEMRGIGEEHWFVVAVHEPTGVVAGLTEIAFVPDQPHFCHQEDTAVLAEFRGRGLGRFIKAAMMHWLTAERPGVERVLTNTAADNTHMIRVNHELGYTTDNIVIKVEVGIETLRTRLGNSLGER